MSVNREWVINADAWTLDDLKPNIYDCAGHLLLKVNCILAASHQKHLDSSAAGHMMTEMDLISRGQAIWKNCVSLDCHVESH